MEEQDEGEEDEARLNLEMRRLVAAHIRLLRRERGWSQEELAHRARIQRTFLQRVEANAANLSLDTLLQLARALEIKPEVFFEPITLTPQSSEDAL